MQKALIFLEGLNKQLRVVNEIILSPFERLWGLVIIALVFAREWRLMEIFFIIFLGLQILDVKDKLKDLEKSRMTQKDKP